MTINIEWDEKFEVGHERIDFEQRIFLGLIREYVGKHYLHSNRIPQWVEKGEHL